TALQLKCSPRQSRVQKLRQRKPQSAQGRARIQERIGLFPMIKMQVDHRPSLPMMDLWWSRPGSVAPQHRPHRDGSVL
ncbi:MAG: hypothetical protein RIQ75_2223, partial [Pseudomonadota bacterium]